MNNLTSLLFGARRNFQMCFGIVEKMHFIFSFNLKNSTQAKSSKTQFRMIRKFISLFTNAHESEIQGTSVTPILSDIETTKEEIQSTEICESFANVKSGGGFLDD